MNDGRPVQRSKDEAAALEALEIELLVEAVFRHYGYDFRQYAFASLRRRVLGAVDEERAGTVSALLARVLHDPAVAERLLRHLTVHTTSLFRDPAFYRAFRASVVPLLRTHPSVRIWHAGCSTGEEVYSMAILLEEEGLGDGIRIYATDLSEAVLKNAKAGVYPLAAMKEYVDNYRASGGTRSFPEYCTTDDESVRLRPSLRSRVVFAAHNLVTDASFNEFHVVLCRNVMIYFQKPLQDRVHALLYDSLAPQGVLAIGRSETIAFSPHEAAYEAIDPQERIFRKVR